jgi:hypothetical protein
LTGKDEEPSELIYFKLYKSQIPVIEQAIETAARMLGSDSQVVGQYLTPNTSLHRPIPMVANFLRYVAKTIILTMI